MAFIKNKGIYTHPTDFAPAKWVDPTSCAVVHQNASSPAKRENVFYSNSSDIHDQNIQFKWKILNLLTLCDPENQAAARVALMTTSTGTRSATASLEALIVRRIPFPA